jgi:nitrous oxidase accessory protein
MTRHLSPPSVTGSLLLLLLTPLAAAAEARTWTVGGNGADFPLIAPAIAGASAGDEIRVRGGVYREDLVVDKPLTIVGEGRPTLYGTGQGTVVTIAAPGCALSGFVIEGSGTGQTNQMDAGVLLRSDGNRIFGNTLRRVFYGVVVSDATRNEIADNEIQGLRELPYGRRGDGVYLYRAPDNVVARNRISGQRDAIYFQYAPRGLAVDNVVSDARFALHDMFSDDAVIARNTFSDSTVGANIMNSRRIRVEGNRMLRNRGVPGLGLTLKDCDDSTVRENMLVGNARALLIDGSSVNEFIDNAFLANDIAIAILSSAERNAFGGNRFTDNWSDVILSGRDSGTRWSIDGRGNSWDRYRGFDFDGDGIGDSPHPLVGAFERIEGANPAARLFLRSPAASGLELAARLGVAAADASDDRPLVSGPAAATPAAARPMWPLMFGVLLSAVVGRAFQARRRGGPERAALQERQKAVTC